VDSTGSGYSPVADSCEHGNEIWGSIKGDDQTPFQWDSQCQKLIVIRNRPEGIIHDSNLRPFTWKVFMHKDTLHSLLKS
jgi:hypothetical protein